MKNVKRCINGRVTRYFDARKYGKNKTAIFLFNIGKYVVSCDSDYFCVTKTTFCFALRIALYLITVNSQM